MVIVTKIYVFAKYFYAFLRHILCHFERSREILLKNSFEKDFSIPLCFSRNDKKKFLIPNFFVFLQVENETNK